jgi:hypothetical protein
MTRWLLVVTAGIVGLACEASVEAKSPQPILAQRPLLADVLREAAEDIKVTLILMPSAMPVTVRPGRSLQGLDSRSRLAVAARQADHKVIWIGSRAVFVRPMSYDELSIMYTPVDKSNP